MSNECVRIVQQLAVVGIVLILMFLGALVIYSNRLKRNAEKVVRVSYELSQQEHPPALDDIRHQFGTQLKQSAACTASGCEYEVTLSNRVLAEIRLAPYTALRSSFWVKGDLLEENDLGLFTVSRRGRGIVAYVDAKYCKRCENFDINPCMGSMASVASGSVQIGSGSRLTDKRTAFAFNTGCLSSLRGCASIAELLPTIWQRTAAGTVQCATTEQR